MKGREAVENAFSVIPESLGTCGKRDSQLRQRGGGRPRTASLRVTRGTLGEAIVHIRVNRRLGSALRMAHEALEHVAEEVIREGRVPTR